MVHKKKCVCGHLLDVEDVYQMGREDEQMNILNWFKDMGWMQAVSAMYGYFETHPDKENKQNE